MQILMFVILVAQGFAATAAAVSTLVSDGDARTMLVAGLAAFAFVVSFRSSGLRRVST